MDTRTGEIVQKETEGEMKNYLDDLDKEDKAFFKKMNLPPTKKQLARKPPKVGRNEPCPCGSGKKFKKCCYLGQ